MPRHQFAHQAAVGRLAALSLLASACGAGSPAPSPEINTVPAPLLGVNTLTPARDTTVHQGAPNQNFGNQKTLGVNKALVAFDQSAVAGEVAGLRLASARLEVTITANPLVRSRSTLNVNRMITNWTEAGATWNCAIDTRPGDNRRNCAGATAWSMDDRPPNPWRSPATAAVTLAPGRTGVVSFDVTADVRAFLQGGSNFGWIIHSGNVDGRAITLGSRESGTPPRLVVTAVCANGFADCDHDPANGCEQSLRSPTACGACGVNCDDGDPCTADACSAAGSCVHVAAADGTACDDGNACTTGDACAAGVCSGGPAVACPAPDPCHAPGTCDPSTGACSNPARADGTACDDGNACTTGDACAAGVCSGGPAVTCPTPDQCHAPGTCDPSTGACSNPARADGIACNDGNACTIDDACAAGTCVPGAARACPSPDGCHPGVCDPATGVCSNPSACAIYGQASVSGTALDGLAVTPARLEDGVPNNQIGGFGSAITYTGVGDLYVTTPDRGPNAGADSYVERAYLLELSLSGGTVTPAFRGGATLRNEAGQTLIGLDTAFDATNSPASRRFDSEGVRVSPAGTFYVSDEYGPFLYEFGPDGTRRRALEMPSKFLIDHPAIEDAELPPTNRKGRQDNRGMEGLAITADGSKLYGIMQSPLIQDGALDGSNKRIGINNRILEIDTATGATREFVYQLDDPSLGVNEILAINDHQFLVDERDGNAGSGAKIKHLTLIDLAGASDVSAVAALPSTGLPPGVVPVSKRLFLDLLDPAYGIVGPSAPEKVEGLAFGPDLPDGHHVLVVTVDNDFIATQPSRIFVFAIDPAALPGFVPQRATFPPGCALPAPVSCPAADVCHLDGMCDPGTGACNEHPAPAGTAAGPQTTGDCRANRCDGAGNLVSVTDDGDLPVDGLACTLDVCANGVPSNPPSPAGTSCGDFGGKLCDGAGHCVSCLTGADCPGSDSDCAVRVCTNGACGVSFAPQGTPIAAQTAGDCQQLVCDGQGGVASVAADFDVPVDGNPCTDDVCFGGVPFNPPAAVDTSCGGSNVCDGAGQCVGCNVATDCPGVDTECAQRTCTVGVCGFTFALANLPVSAQTAGDCRRNVCDGQGNVVSAVDDADVPADNRDCTADVCNTGVPSNPSLAYGATCAQNGGIVCDGAGNCGAPTVRVVREGDGGAALGSAATAVFVDQYTTAGVFKGTVALPTAAAGANQPLTNSGSATSEGALSLSGDGRFLVLAGYAATPATAGIAGTTTAAVRRVIGRIDAFGTVDTSSLLTTAFSGNNVRSAASADGSGFWAAGAGGGTGGIWFIPLGGSGGVQVVSSPNNFRCAEVIGGQLYASAANGSAFDVFAVGSGLPVVGGTTVTGLTGNTSTAASPYAYQLFDLDPSVPGPDTLYVADDRASASGGGVQKWALAGGKATLVATLNVAPTPIGFRGLTGFVANGQVTLVGTTADANVNRLVVIVDNGTPGATVAAAPTNTLFRGVALSPHP